MSIQHVSAVLDCRDPRLFGSRKLVLVILANRTDHLGRCWPSQELSAAECGISVRALADHLKALEADKFIRRETQHLGRGNGSRTTYTLNLVALQNAPADIAPADIAPAISVECTGSRPHVTNHQEPTVLKEEAKASSKKSDSRGSRLPADWTLPDDWLAEARRIAIKFKANLTNEETGNEADRFRDYWHSRAGAAGRKSDWFATWRNWIRSYLERRPKPRDARGGHGSPANGQHGSGTIADAAIRRHLQRQNGNGVPHDAGRGHDVPPEGDIVDGQFRLVS